MTITFDDQIRSATRSASKCAQELQQDRNAIGFGMRRESANNVTGKTMIGSLAQRLRPVFHRRRMAVRLRAIPASLPRGRSARRNAHALP
jgi:hypothetical protein